MTLPYFWLGDAAEYDGEVLMAYELERLFAESEAVVIDSTEFADD